MPASSSQMALSTVSNASTVANQPRPLSQFLSEPPSNPNNPFLSPNAPWPVTGNGTSATANPMPSLPAPTNTSTTAASKGDLDSRLAEIAGQLSISSKSGTSAMNSNISKPPPAALTAASATNPWLGPGGVLQPTPVNNPSLPTNQVGITVNIAIISVYGMNQFERRLK